MATINIAKPKHRVSFIEVVNTIFHKFFRGDKQIIEKSPLSLANWEIKPQVARQDFESMNIEITQDIARIYLGGIQTQNQ